MKCQICTHDFAELAPLFKVQPGDVPFTAKAPGGIFKMPSAPSQALLVWLGIAI